MLNMKTLREQLNAEVNVHALAVEVYDLKDVEFDTREQVIERILGEEYRLAFI